jgi:hypothetical protein
MRLENFWNCTILLQFGNRFVPALEAHLASKRSLLVGTSATVKGQLFSSRIRMKATPSFPKHTHAGLAFAGQYSAFRGQPK